MIKNHNILKSKKIAFIVLACILCWLGVANFSAWYANTMYPDNIQKSFIGNFITNVAQLAKSNKEMSRLDIDEKALFEKLTVRNDSFYLSVLNSTDQAIYNIDEIKQRQNTLLIRGWGVAPGGSGRAEYIVARYQDSIISIIKIGISRPDVAAALDDRNALNSGYSGDILLPSGAKICALKLYILTSSLKLLPMSINCSDGDQNQTQIPDTL